MDYCRIGLFDRTLTANRCGQGAATKPTLLLGMAGGTPPASMYLFLLLLLTFSIAQCQIVSQSVTKFNEYATPAQSTMLSFLDLVRQRSQGNQVQQVSAFRVLESTEPIAVIMFLFTRTVPLRSTARRGQVHHLRWALSSEQHRGGDDHVRRSEHGSAHSRPTCRRNCRFGNMANGGCRVDTNGTKYGECTEWNDSIGTACAPKIWRRQSRVMLCTTHWELFVWPTSQ